ncbi:CDP-glycerol glycerophosphotransferase family protein [Campylobacter sp. MIT 21-1685]|uniref:CDP-glycerol glycerophosphotransferase family protein n=1 Tax=unclassified Campylobacter TaxID=2593542 RepID=UPI00224B7245|nr:MULTISPECIES: CDP-glycerol glycerophosphotransferase family protein [unclassified Campylobacter]MCX2683662.1 CDP-glycerol glycerophosphotransferase family protein [Campylobacter sp. MIT 21-1684]MCX2751936.1 CDP-glycerol glycerophosphotransferase family protein [Campylobacter sp. MIT 21-1682]MCX2808137.1 CDP-glycerol glycerophosphotransferase family protein [Campylobacter sp. MIT 21-1685]
MLRLSAHNKNFLKTLINGISKIYLQKLYSQIKPKKYKSNYYFIIISPVYNVEKYLKDYFESFIHQRLDFKNNIHLICIDDGSTDNSSSIIKRYQKKFPDNISYIYKTNGGQASARNLGLKLLKGILYDTNCNNTALSKEELKKLQEKFKHYALCTDSKDTKKNLQKLWLGFTDPDDFLDRECLYKVERFLHSYNKHTRYTKEKDFNTKQNLHNDLGMISTNIIFYYELSKKFPKGLYKDEHPLNFKFQEKETVLTNSNLESFIQLAAMSVFINFSKLPHNLYFDEDLKPNFEDAKFINEFLLENIHSKSAFLQDSKLYYRKRIDKSSTLDTKNENNFKQVLEIGYLDLLKKSKRKFACIPNFIQNTIIYDLFWVIKDTLNQYSCEDQRTVVLWEKIFSEIEEKNIENFYFTHFDDFYKMGILNRFKGIQQTPTKAFINAFDTKKDQIQISYFHTQKEFQRELKIDGKTKEILYEKIRKIELFNRDFCYETLFWIQIEKHSSELDIILNNQKLQIIFNEKTLKNLNIIHQKMFSLKKERKKNLPIWLFSDKAFKADDNAEHLYRYLMQIQAKQQKFFILKKTSPDYSRLQKEGFQLIDPTTLKFKYLLHKADKIISSHIDSYLFNAFGGDTLRAKDFIFLQHGVTKNNLSKWLNKRKIDLFITATKNEFHSIQDNYNSYKFSSKEIKLTGFARHDNLLHQAKTYSPKKQILIMPTWREKLAGKMQRFNQRKINTDFTQSEYFKTYQSLLISERLAQLCKQFHYEILFHPHPEILPYLHSFSLPNWILIHSSETSLQKLFAESALMITDYSSVAFEMGYLGKGVLYYQFDEKDFWKKHTLAKGYFNYRRDGFGPVCVNEKELLDTLEKILANDCKIDEPYISNIQSTFEFKDGKNCERIYEEILKLE